MNSVRRSYFNILHSLAERTSSPRFSILHRTVKDLYALSIPSWVEMSINGLSSRERSQVRLRGSINSPDRFHIFLSDLDLEILVPHEDENHFQAIRERVARLKIFFPPLGEAEIYSFDEKKKYDEILEDISETYTFLRKARKVVWMKRALDKAETRYHQMKASRSRYFCLRDLIRNTPTDDALPVAISEFIKSKFPNNTNTDAKSMIGNSALSQYIGMRIVLGAETSGEDSSEYHHLVLPENEGLILLAISPNYFPDEKFSPIIRELRGIPSIKSAFLKLSELELLIATAVRRATPEVIPLEWIDSLKKSVSLAKE